MNFNDWKKVIWSFRNGIFFFIFCYIYYCFIRWAAWQWSVTWWDVEILPLPRQARDYRDYYCLHIQRYGDTQIVSDLHGYWTILIIIMFHTWWIVNIYHHLHTTLKGRFLLYLVRNFIGILHKSMIISDPLFSLIIFIYVSITFCYMFFAFCW